jgi:hypothetical protein
LRLAERLDILIEGEICMKSEMRLIFFVVCAFVCSRVISAAELQIIVMGHGFVQGDKIGCDTTCKYNFTSGTVVQLQAIPYPDARFVEWKVDGQPQQTGTITLEKDTVVSAIFKLKDEPPADKLIVNWYNGDSKESGTIALDEMVIFLKERTKWGVTTDAEYTVAIQEIIHRFHPHAEITSRGRDLLSLKSPEPLTQENWFKTLALYSELRYVKYAGPVVYISGTASGTILYEEVSVKFPGSYTESQILKIEQEYTLVRLKSIIPNKFTYYVGSPLAAVETANRLYESGLVVYAIPNRTITMDVN